MLEWLRCARPLDPSCVYIRAFEDLHSIIFQESGVHRTSEEVKMIQERERHVKQLQGELEVQYKAVCAKGNALATSTVRRWLHRGGLAKEELQYTRDG